MSCRSPLRLSSNPTERGSMGTNLKGEWVLVRAPGKSGYPEVMDYIFVKEGSESEIQLCCGKYLYFILLSL